MINHRKYKHEAKSKNTCVDCKRNFVYRRDLQEHLESLRATCSAANNGFTSIKKRPKKIRVCSASQEIDVGSSRESDDTSSIQEEIECIEQVEGQDELRRFSWLEL